MDPLSITVSIVAILTAAAKVSSILGLVKDAPESMSAILIEVDHIKIVFTALRKFLDRTHRFAPQRAALIQLDDVVVVLTQTVLVFSELETLVRPLSAQGSLSPWWRLNWARHQPTASRLVNQLQRHKVTLSLILQIIQWLVGCVACYELSSNAYSDSNVDAQHSAASLQDNIEQQVESSSDWVARLEQLQISPNANQPNEVIKLVSMPPHGSSFEQTPLAGDTPPTRAPSPPSIAQTDESIPDADPSVQATFEVVLSTTRVYDRVKDREIDAMSRVSTNRSRAWSVLSGLSLAEVSAVAVIKLPLHVPELQRFWNLASPSAMSTDTSPASHYDWLDGTERSKYHNIPNKMQDMLKGNSRAVFA